MQNLLAQATPITSNVANFTDLEPMFGNIVLVVIELAGLALFIMLLVGGFKYITSGGDPKAAESAKMTLTYSIGGLVLVASAYLILRTIGVITGVGVLNFAIVKQP